MGRRRARPEGPDGVLLVDKPAGPTSAALVDWVRWALAGARVGHCGTLDPAATGLVVIAVGRATRIAGHLTEGDKTYRARFALGRSTDTADADGATVQTAPVGDDDLRRAADVIEGWPGTHQLRPPAYSAVKVDGKRAYALARDGVDIELAPRPMTIRTCSDVEVEPGVVAVSLQVSKGTYIRSLAEALGRAVERPVHLGGLRRLRSGHLGLDDPRTIAGLSVSPIAAGRDGKPRHRIRWGAAPDDRAAQATALTSRLVPLSEACPLPTVALAPTAPGADVLRRLGHGQRVPLTDPGWPVAAGAWPPATDGAPWAVAGTEPGEPALLLVRVTDGVVEPFRTVVPARGDRTPPDGTEPEPQGGA